MARGVDDFSLFIGKNSNMWCTLAGKQKLKYYLASKTQTQSVSSKFYFQLLQVSILTNFFSHDTQDLKPIESLAQSHGLLRYLQTKIIEAVERSR